MRIGELVEMGADAEGRSVKVVGVLVAYDVDQNLALLEYAGAKLTVHTDLLQGGHDQVDFKVELGSLYSVRTRPRPPRERATRTHGASGPKECRCSCCCSCSCCARILYSHRCCSTAHVRGPCNSCRAGLGTQMI